MSPQRSNACAPCKCGRVPRSVATQVAEDCVETQVVCDCGQRGPLYEHWRADHENAVYAWNCGDRDEPLAPALERESPMSQRQPDTPEILERLRNIGPAIGLIAASRIEHDADRIARLEAELKRLADVADNLIAETSDPGTEALAAVWCARDLLRRKAP